jgi:hypothetical protein
MLGRPSAEQKEYFPARDTLGKKKRQNQKEETKLETLNPQVVKSFSTPHYTEKRGGLQTSLGDTDKQDWMLKE